MSQAVLESFRGRNVLIVGFAREAAALVPVLSEAGARITLSDTRPAEALSPFLQQVAPYPVRLSLGANRIDDVEAADVVFVSPGVPRWIPALEVARELGKPIWSETRLFFELCRAPIVGVTGSSGKTTTTSLVGHLIAASGRQVFVGGNIGHPLIGQATRIAPDALVVLELSSFQLQELRRSPHVAVVTTVTPDHLDVHRSMDEYVEAKSQIVRHQGSSDVAILNAENEYTRAYAGLTRAQVLWFNNGPAVEGVWLHDGVIMARLPGREPEPIAAASAVPLRGAHNLANASAAVAAALAVGVGPGVIAGALPNFQAIEHRLELVAEVDGVRYYNDSIATSPERAAAAIVSFDEPVILIAGGRTKNLDVTAFGRLVAERCRAVLLVGESANELRAAIEAADGPRRPELIDAGTLEVAVSRAGAMARPGDVVLLAPAYTSFDQHPDYAARGRAFKALVAALTGAA